MAAVGLEELDSYVLRRHNTIAQGITNSLILDLCLSAEFIPGTLVSCQWWEYECIDLDGGRMATVGVKRVELEDGAESEVEYQGGGWKVGPGRGIETNRDKQKLIIIGTYPSGGISSNMGWRFTDRL